MDLFQNQPSRRVKILRDSVAQKIAAGEVIDRPFSVVRELLDNALDAGADRLDLHLEQGGIRKIRLADNGRGMTPEDLKLCWQPHATSKISEVEDLESLSSLGFRGEALSSIASCSRLTLISRPADAAEGWQISIHGGEQKKWTPLRAAKGTVVDVSDLFYALPARRRFMKSPSAETRLCRTTLMEKALPFPQCAFQLHTDGKLRLNLPPASLKERVVQAFEGTLPAGMLEELSHEGDSFSIKVIAGRPELQRKDRRRIQIFINRRRVDEYALVQAVEYGYRGVLPGGVFPTALVFIEVDPSLIDINIHPAKREVRFRDRGSLHKTIVYLLEEMNRNQRERAVRLSIPRSPYAQGDLAQEKSFLPSPEQAPDSDPPRHPVPPGPDKLFPSRHRIQNTKTFLSAQKDLSLQSDVPAEPRETRTPSFRYHGQIMKLFLLAEVEDRLLIIDQHAAHERIIYDSLRQGTHPSQGLLPPWELDLSREEAQFLFDQRDSLGKLGFSVEGTPEEGLRLTSLPASLREEGEGIIELLTTQAGNFGAWERRLYAQISCRSAIKDGEILDEITGRDLVRRALALPEPRCPHGRPVWFELSRQELFEFLGRLI